jgi:hypothetical protein
VDLLTDIGDEDIETDGIRLLFLAGLSTREGTFPNVNVIALSVPRGTTLEDYEVASAENLKEFIPSSQVLSQSRIQISGYPSSMVEKEAESQDYGLLPGDRFRHTQVGLIRGRVAWEITCTLLYDFSPDQIGTCESVARSFRFID